VDEFSPSTCHVLLDFYKRVAAPETATFVYICVIPSVWVLFVHASANRIIQKVLYTFS